MIPLGVREVESRWHWSSHNCDLNREESELPNKQNRALGGCCRLFKLKWDSMALAVPMTINKLPESNSI